MFGLQLRHESSDLLIEAPPLASSEHIRILSCCTHFAESKRNRADLVVVLASDASLHKLARSAGISSQKISSFAAAHGFVQTARQPSNTGRKKVGKSTPSGSKVTTIRRDRK